MNQRRVRSASQPGQSAATAMPTAHREPPQVGRSGSDIGHPPARYLPTRGYFSGRV